MKDFNRKQAKKDLEFLALKVMKASKELQEAYIRIKDIYEDI